MTLIIRFSINFTFWCRRIVIIVIFWLNINYRASKKNIFQCWLSIKWDTFVRHFCKVFLHHMEFVLKCISTLDFKKESFSQNLSIWLDQDLLGSYFIMRQEIWLLEQNCAINWFTNEFHIIILQSFSNLLWTFKITVKNRMILVIWGKVSS